MGRIAALLSFLRVTRNGANVSDVKTDTGGGVNITSEHFGPIGDDAYPLLTDYVYLNERVSEGRKDAIAYLDPINEPKALEGDKRIYSRDKDNGAVVADIWLKSDGSILADNGSGSFELKANGDVVINGVTIDVSGNITGPGTITIGGKELSIHTHAQGVDSDGDVQQNTGPNL